MSKGKIHYITIKSKEYKAIKVLIGILIATNIILCFKEMQLMRRYNEVMKEKEALEEIIEVQKGVIDETRQQ